jgi:AraC family transcriptional regulator
MKFGEVRCAQNDGSPPLTLIAGGPPGESGVSVLRMKFRRGAHFSATTRQHLICFQLSRYLWLQCRMAGRTLHHETTTGSLAICPAGIDCSAETDASVDMLLIATRPGQLALAAAEDSALEAQLNERLSGYDQRLLGFARALASENAEGYPNGPLFWNEAASQFISRLVFGHTSMPDNLARGTLGTCALKRIRATSWLIFRSR